jgi:hypothetical protein
MYRATVPSWRVHRALALLVSTSLPKEVVKGLLEGVVEPDVAADRKIACRRMFCRIVRVKHHAGVPWGLVEYYYNLACFYRARGDHYSAGRALGRALHYIHDGVVVATRNIHDKIEREMDELVKNLPNLCKNKKYTNKAAEMLCSAYLESKWLIERFMEEPLLPQKEALKTLWLGRAKRWWPAAVFIMIFISPFITSPLISFAAFTLATLWFSATWTWMPEEYVVAMRSGATCVKPQKYLPAITC